jgi:hypothetical protein
MSRALLRRSAVDRLAGVVTPHAMMRASPSSAPLGIATLMLAWAGPLVAQGSRPLDTMAQQQLQFGTVIPGLPTTISWSDAAAAGQFQLRGTGGAQVRIEFTLPTGLMGPGGTTLPVMFGATDGAYAAQPSLNATITFDPRLPLVTTLSKSGRLYLRLGGTVTPSPTQASGPYNSTVTITVSYTGV